MKRKLLFIFLIFLGMQMFPVTNQNWVSAERNRQNETGDLERVAQFAHVLEASHAKVTEWSVYIRETGRSAGITHAAFNREVKNKLRELPDYAWHRLQAHDGTIGWEGTRKLPGSHAEMVVRVMGYPIGTRYRTVTLYHVNGERFKQAEWTNNKRQIREEIPKIFHGQEHIYTCVKADRSAKMNLALIEEGKRYLDLFSAAPVERLQEKTFVSISAYTKAWNNAIYTKNKKMNIQAALRNDGDRTIIVLGSPIITVEY
ncbi:YwmB family TATA-box binding protein [Sporolactobacillus sp. CPB3-1]|uniref:YwmB family TATA-box binding protein n=1 Tax=Sporolactobacillus mangiferae TaxID=2940498 RepID=A0ABT0MAG1_9BACL|nr:YwmB family TATA-box binding protein [Sporolactobacillus mangiferae]MCL1631264.1 YwmB family TATA-box binding protein [Sporolactobacillus mangiferae]